MGTWLRFENCWPNTSSAYASSSRAKWSARFAVASVCVALVACGDGTGEDPDASTPGMDAATSDGGTEHDGSITPDAGPPGCTSDAECDDGVDCTSDTCTTATGACRHQVVPALCPPGSSCHPVRGCEMGRPCAIDDDCEDEDACRVNERCDPAARTCVTDPLDGDGDGDPPRVCGGGDCDDSHASVYAGAPELCDGLDNDCDGGVDETFDFATDPEHCGSCGHACGLGTCIAGACACDPGAAECGESGCLDTESDPDHCGGCGMACGTYLACGDGVCTRCEAPGDPCCRGGRCLRYGGSVPFDSPWLVCIDGVCDCPPGETACPPGAEVPTYCADLDVDAANCGACENVCPSGTTCVGGMCRCPAGQTPCSGACTDLSTDSANCGACGLSCSWPLICVSGSCACPIGTTFCEGRSGGCVDLVRDENNCGACENACAGWGVEECVGGACVACGGVGEVCCDLDSGGRAFCDGGLVCDAGTGTCR